MRPPGRVPELAGIDRPRAARVLGTAVGDGAWLTPGAAREVLEAYGLRLPPAEVVHSAQAAMDAATRIGFPVVCKLVSSTIVHKSDVGGVATNLADRASVRAAFMAMQQRLAELGREEEMDGALVQRMIPGGVETFVGVTTDPAFGPLLGFGSGGVFIEVWRDVVFRVAPVTDVDAREMLGEIRGAKLLRGYRGTAPCDLQALEDAILRVSQLVSDFPQIREVEINPLLALPAPQGALALDVRISVGASPDGSR